MGSEMCIRDRSNGNRIDKTIITMGQKCHGIRKGHVEKSHVIGEVLAIPIPVVRSVARRSVPAVSPAMEVKDMRICDVYPPAVSKMWWRERFGNDV